MLQIRTTSKVGYTKKNKKTDLSQISTVRKPEQNQGGLLGGLGYVGGSIAAGVGGIVEGIVDIGAAGIALLGGDKEYAKYVFKDNVVGDWHQSLRDDYNPGTGWSFVGDVAQGIGQSATMLIPYVGVPAFFVGVGSQGISSAAAKTGDVGFKEVAYGVTTGIVEGGLEWALGAAGSGAKSIASAIAKKGGTGAVKTVLGSAVRKGLAGKVLSAAGGEFLEEAASEIIDVGLQKMWQIDPNASTTVKDVLYSGIVGAVSGGVMGGSVAVVQTLNNRAAGQKVIRDGNAQTLVNTANSVADKLAGNGTNFRKASEWIKTLRGEVDAYNKLVKDGKQNSASAEVILGEMKASLFFAETQAIHFGLTESIKNSSEDNRALLAEYINQTVDKSKRKKNYTALDIANDTDGIATQLGIMQFASDTFINYADAINSMNANEQQEGEIGGVIQKMQSDAAKREAERPTVAPIAKTNTEPASAKVAPVEVKTAKSAAPTVDVAKAAPTVKTEADTAKATAAPVVSAVKNDLAEAKYSKAVAKKAQAKIKQNEAKAPSKLEGIIKTGAEINNANSVAANAAPTLNKATSEPSGVIVGGLAQRGAETKNTAPTVAQSQNVEVAQNAESEPVINQPKESKTDVQREQAAKENATKLIEWQKKAQPTTRELNSAREAVKDFDNMPPVVKESVVKMIRSAEGKVDRQIVKGVSNLMTLRRRNGSLVMPDLEVRFAEGIGDENRGLYTHIGEGENKKTLILINAKADSKAAMQGTIAHEIVHYIENRKGYSELAEYVKGLASESEIAEIKQRYTDHYTEIYTEEESENGLVGEELTKKVAERMATDEYRTLVDSEVVASLIGERLTNEKFLQKYATKDDAMIKKIFRFLKSTAGYLKDKDKTARGEVLELVKMFSGAIGTEVTAESEGTRTEKYALPSKKDPNKLDPRTVTKEDVYTLLENAASGKYDDDTYIPVRISTPAIVIQRIKEKMGMEIPNYPLIMSVKKAINAMERRGVGDDGLPNRLSPNEIIRVIEAMSNPQYIVFEPANEEHSAPRYVEVVKFDLENGRKAFAVLELSGEYKDSEQIKDNFENGNYNVFVTVYPPKLYKLNELLNNKNNKIIYDKKKDFPQVTSGIIVPSVLNDPSFFDNSIHQNESVVNTSDEKILSDEDKELLFAEAEARAYEGEIKEYILQNARYYYKSEFNKAFWEAKSVGGEVLGDILSGKKTSIKGDDLDRIKSAVYTSMFKASAEGKVGAVDAVKAIAKKAAQRYIDNQTVYDEESKRLVPLKKYVDDTELIGEYEKALSEMLFNSFANSGKNLRNFQNFSLQKEAAEKFRQMYFDFKELEKYKKQAANNAMDLKQIANMQKRAAADEGIRMLAKAMGDTVNKHGMIRASKIDAVLAQVSDFYNLETNVKIFGESENGEQLKSLTDYAQVYDKGARNKIDKLLKLRKDRQGKALTSEEMKLWAQILGAMRVTINQYNGLYKDGKWFDRTKVAGDLAKDVVSYFGYNTEKKFKNVFLEGLYKTGKNYLYSVISPETLIEGLEGYAHRGVLKTFFHSVRDASALADTVRAKLLIKFKTFLDSNENVWEEKNRKIKFREKLNKKSIDLFGNEITLGEAIYLYGLCKREHAQAGLAKEGIKIYDENGKLKKQIREIDAEKARDYLYNQFDAVDRKYIDMVEEFFNKTSTEMKSKADLEYLGYSNTISGYYIPILRDRFSRDRRTTDRRSSISDIITVYNEQFNQHVTQNAKPCEITNIQQIVSTHAKGLADYSCLYMPLKSFDRLYNAPVILDDGRSTTIREILNDVWPDADNYLADLFGDIQGVGRPTGRFDTLDKLAQKITNTWVPSTLSGNLSVIMNQTTSYISASQAIEPKYLVQAMGAIGHNMKEIGDRADEFSKIIFSRSFEEGAIRSQTNVEQVNKVGKFLGKGIEYTDRQICLLVFHAAEIKAEANGDGAIGTEENSRAAAIIADKVIQETQSMTSPAERGAWQRSPNMLSRAVTQFAGDSMKGFSYTFSSVARFFAHKNRVKAGDTEYEADLKQDAKKIGRSVATIATTSAYMAAIAWLMRVVLNTTEDEPEEEAINVLGDFAGNVVGVMPLVSDVYSYFVDGYEITPTSIDLINDTMKSTQNTLSMLGRAVSGKNVTYEETVKGIRGALVSIGSLTGIPINPIIKQATGLVRRISPSAIYWYDSALSSESFSHELERALEKCDERLAQTILEMRYKHESTGEINGEELLEICRLYQLKDENGEYHTDVIPQNIPEELTTRKQRKKFKSIYSKASGEVIKLIDSLEYKNLTDEEKIKAIKNTYKLYYNKAKNAVLETEISNAEAYAIILGDTSNLYISQAKKSFMEVYEDKDGNEVSVKDQVQEYLKLLDMTDGEYTVINYALGYRSKESKAKFLEYINSINLSNKDKEQIAKRLGFIVENGKIVGEPQK